MLKLKSNVPVEDLQDLKFEKGKLYWNCGDISINMDTGHIYLKSYSSARGPRSYKNLLPDVLLTMFEKGMIERG